MISIWNWGASLFILLTPLFALAGSFSSEGQVHLGQRQFLSDPSPKPDAFQKSAPFMTVTPILQWAGEDTRFRLKMIAGLDQTEFEAKDRTQLIPQEFFVEHRQGPINVVLGLNTFNWGVTDVVNPLDVINPRWMRNALSPQKIGSAGLALAWAGDNGGFDFVYIPRQFPHELPTPTSRYLPRDASLGNYVAEFQGTPVEVRTPATPLHFTYSEHKDPSHALDNNFAVRYRQTIGSLDLHVVGFEGIPGFPDFSAPSVTLNVINFSPLTLELDPNIELEPKYQRVRIAGFGGVWTVAGMLVKLVHAETWRTSTDFEVSTPRTTVLGLEKSLSLKGLESTWIYQHTLIEDSSKLAASVYSTREIFDKSHLLGLRLSAGFDWNLLMAAILNPVSGTNIAQVEGQYRLSDRYQLKASIQSIQGREGTLAKSLEKASEAQLGVLVFW